ncbi:MULTISPECIES: glycosyltransferase family 2 protein [Blautia]|uniref:glycosyltransferase family 2 protein n=1 Tax=Blautia TaxID=572511 RepID=UPI00258F2952|nr:MULTISPECIES: glycosyltransferase family 2 protein [Blautia]
MLKLSVIVPVYKVEKYLRRCIDSILEQNYRDIELILVDDGSPDWCPEMCDQYQKKDKRVRVIHQKNSGVAVARNAGMRMATGDYITFVDSDDYIDREMYLSMFEIIEQYQCDVVMCDCVKEFGTHKELYTHDIRSGYYNEKQLKEEYYPHLLMMENVEYPATISNWLCVFKNKRGGKDFAIEYEPGIRYSEDLLFGARLLRQADSFYYMKGQAYYHYCMNPESVTHKFVPDKWQDYQKLHRKIEEYFENDKTFDFQHQIDLCLLFFLYNAVGDIWREQSLNTHEKRRMVLNILKDNKVKKMFRRINIFKLPISNKLKVITLLYKYQFVWLFT